MLQSGKPVEEGTTHVCLEGRRGWEPYISHHRVQSRNLEVGKQNTLAFLDLFVVQYLSPEK